MRVQPVPPQALLFYPAPQIMLHSIPGLALRRALGRGASSRPRLCGSQVHGLPHQGKIKVQWRRQMDQRAH